jgi:hypothetical protein
VLINGHERDFMMATSLANFEAINHVPVFYGARHGAGHTATVDHPGGGEDDAPRSISERLTVCM